MILRNVEVHIFKHGLYLTLEILRLANICSSKTPKHNLQILSHLTDFVKFRAWALYLRLGTRYDVDNKKLCHFKIE